MSTAPQFSVYRSPSRSAAKPLVVVVQLDRLPVDSVESSQHGMDVAVIHNFGLLDDYAYPVGNLIIDKSGALYGAVLDSGSLTTAGDPWEAMPSFLE